MGRVSGGKHCDSTAIYLGCHQSVFLLYQIYLVLKHRALPSTHLSLWLKLFGGWRKNKCLHNTKYMCIQRGQTSSILELVTLRERASTVASSVLCTEPKYKLASDCNHCILCYSIIRPIYYY